MAKTACVAVAAAVAAAAIVGQKRDENGGGCSMVLQFGGLADSS